MYKNLEAELVRASISPEEACEHLGICRKTYTQKMNGSTDWSLKELVSLREFINDRLRTDYSLDYLFERYGN